MPRASKTEQEDSGTIWSVSHGKLPMPGTVIAGKLRVERVLAAGGGGTILQAHHLLLDQRVAIKFLCGETRDYPELVERFEREARVAARIRSQHAARVIDCGQLEEGTPFIVLEYLEGEDLAAHLRNRGPLSVKQAVRYLLQACEALAEVHASGIVHRDLKPANLFLAKQAGTARIIKLLDFGISKVLGEDLTERSRFLGTAMYTAPEQLRSSAKVDPRADIWALGVILYEMLAGTPPFTGKTLLDIHEKVFANDPAPLATRRHDLPRPLEEIVGKCMMTDPGARYASVLELASDLAPLASRGDRHSVRTIRVAAGGDSDELEAANLYAPTHPPPALTAPSRSAPVTSPSLAGVTRTHGQEQLRPTPLARRHLIAGALASMFVLGTIAGTRPWSSAEAPVAAATAPTTIRASIEAAPVGAHVRIDDGPRLALPLETKLPRDDREHRLVIEAVGHLPQTVSVRFASDVHVSLALAPAPAVAPPTLTPTPAPTTLTPEPARGHAPPPKPAGGTSTSRDGGLSSHVQPDHAWGTEPAPDDVLGVDLPQLPARTVRWR